VNEEFSVYQRVPFKVKLLEKLLGAVDECRHLFLG
jgi:hypothetical protein